MKVNEIFLSIEGEGKRAGLPCTFIRLFGCNLNCSYCDTRYSCEGEDYTVMSIPQILECVNSHKVKNVTVTGGEPLIHEGIDTLIQTLLDNGYNVNIETNGTQFPKRYSVAPSHYALNPRIMDTEPIYDDTCGSLFYTMDWKCNSSGMEDKMHMDLVNALTKEDVLKFVVGSVQDMDGALAVIEQMTSKPQVFFSPVFGQIEPKEIVAYLLDKQLFDCKVQLQMHKFIWEPTKRGV